MIFWVYASAITNLTLWGIAVLGLEMSRNVGLIILYVNFMRNLRYITHCEEEMPISKAYIVRICSIYLRHVS